MLDPRLTGIWKGEHHHCSVDFSFIIRLTPPSSHERALLFYTCICLILVSINKMISHTELLYTFLGLTRDF